MKTIDKKAEILLVEDDPNLSIVLKDYLQMLNYSVTLCKDGNEGFETYRKKSFDLCVLDVMMPEKDGFSLAREIRKKNQQIPLIFLTAKTLKEDRIKGFKIGCDDYITKPFSTEELSLRIEAILKRCQTGLQSSIPESAEVFKFGSFEFDYSNMLLHGKSGKQNLTRKEAELLRLLCLNLNKLLTRESALKTIWGTDDYFIGRSMDVFITKLRKYLKSDNSVSITNVHGTGFKLEVR